MAIKCIYRMTKIVKIALFQGNKIRRHWDSEKELWYFSVSDVVAVLTNKLGCDSSFRKEVHSLQSTAL